MGKNTFEDDPDVQALRASMRPTASPMSWGRVVTGVVVIACLTFAFAYYLPLQRAHASLNERFSELKSQVDSGQRALDESRKQAAALEEKQRTLESQANLTRQTEKSRTEASQTLKSALESKLQKVVAKDQAAVGLSGTQTVASISLAHLLTAGKLEVSPQGKLTLCSAAGAAGERALRVVAVADKKSIPAPLAAKLKTPLQYSVAVAQVVTETLLDKCNVPAARLSATGVPVEPAGAAKLDGKKLGGPRIELWLD
jgi:F0F1-type ATP synthase membrane subunit b/b'